MENLHGRVAFVFEEIDFDVDQIVGVKNIKIQDVGELLSVAMKSYDTDFAQKVTAGDFLVGNENFGYGHPHYPPMIAMRHLGISGVIAESFSPGYWRGEVAMGFPQISCPGIMTMVDRWDILEVDWNQGTVNNITKNTQLTFETLSEADLEMLEAGGLIGYLHARE